MSMCRSHPPRQSVAPYVLPLFLVAVVCGLLVWRFWPATDRTVPTPPVELRTTTARETLWEIEAATTELYKKAAPSVVHITTLAHRRDFFTRNIMRIPRGTGSGFVWDKQGRIVTNLHVIQGASEARVTLAHETNPRRAGLIGYDRSKDLAVLQIDAAGLELPPIPLGESSKLQVGQFAFAIGGPFGLKQSLSMGVISALDREIGTEDNLISGVIQTTAPINPGNSGGPLLDSAGRLIGVNTAIVSPSGAFAGVGFAIPADDVNRVVTRVINQARQ
jgi:S1-C subfamily serine protease